jgi:hypothetical protein
VFGIFEFDFDGLGRLVEWIFGRAAHQPRWWIAVWLAGVLVVTAIAVVCHAPFVAYVILLVVAVVVVFADGRSGLAS